ncbi:MAG: hypothetical protein OXU20_04035 [Myxococcales bacterium]|nr:hypothetical protein [Myxococcales bacterium]MDD9968020.1 hypothetical protein [Myxococcales bacterium]
MEEKLKQLRPDSGMHLPQAIVVGLTHGAPSALGVQLSIDGGRPSARRTPATGRRVRAEQKLQTFREASGGLIRQLNMALGGAADYPVLGGLLGTAAGLGAGGAGFIFAAAATVLSASRKSNRVFARDGDELWRVEEIGISADGSSREPTYVAAYFLIDPFRRPSATTKGWLLHEDRYQLQ